MGSHRPGQWDYSMRAISTCHFLAVSAAMTILMVPLWPRSIASAAIIYSGTNLDVQATSLVAPGGTLRAFTRSAVGKNGAQPRVFDSTKSGQGGTGITTTGNLLHQVWEGGFVPTPTANLVVPGSIPQSIDTHFLVDTASLFIAQLPAENRPLLAPSLHPFAGYGSFLTGAFALVGPANLTWNFAYIVVPVGTTVHFDFELGAAGFSSETVAAALAVVFAPGDLNMDGLVNIFDLNLVSANWGGIGPAGDANGDGTVNIFDINLISAHWTVAGDMNGDRLVNIFDINLVSSH